MPSLSSLNRSPSQRITWLPIAVNVLTALVALLRVRAFTTPTPTAASGRPPAAVAAPMPLPVLKADKATTVASNVPTCHAIMQRLSGSLVAMPSTADKPGTVMTDADKADVMMIYSHSDSITIPVPGGKPR